jgi:hypothetical protein
MALANSWVLQSPSVIGSAASHHWFNGHQIFFHLFYWAAVYPADADHAAPDVVWIGLTDCARLNGQ